LNSRRKDQIPEMMMGADIERLITKLERQDSMDGNAREELQSALHQLTDLKFALDESSIVAVTDHKGVIRYVNDRFCEVSKYSRAELVGQDHRVINSKYHSKPFMQHLWFTIQSGKVWHGEIRNRAKDGSYYWVNTTIVPFLNEAGEPYQYLAIRNEVTQLKQVEEELQHMMVKMMRIQEDERQRFSRELHDGIGQSLFSLLIQIDRLQHGLDSEELGTVRDEVSKIIEDVRGMAWELRPSVLDDLGVVPAIRSYIQTFSQHTAIEVNLRSNVKQRLNVEVETAIYRIVQEALTNIRKYANVNKVDICLWEDEEMIEASVIDYGQGFSLQEKRPGVGLFSMEERARVVGGALTIDSAPGQGTAVQFKVPKNDLKNLSG
jgi:two-component system sensor histidine kinase NreB